MKKILIITGLAIAFMGTQVVDVKATSKPAAKAPAKAPAKPGAKPAAAPHGTGGPKDEAERQENIKSATELCADATGELKALCPEILKCENAEKVGTPTSAACQATFKKEEEIVAKEESEGGEANGEDGHGDEDEMGGHDMGGMGKDDMGNMGGSDMGDMGGSDMGDDH